MNEPATIGFLADPTLPTSTRHALDGLGGDHGDAHNVYGLLMNQAGFDGLRAVHPERRPFIVSRSGWAGTQRYAWNWTADVESTWEGMRQQVATLLGLGLSGVPFSGFDIGGFSGVVPDAELYLRWLQMAVFVPFCRTHGVVGSPPPRAVALPVGGGRGDAVVDPFPVPPAALPLHVGPRGGVPRGAADAATVVAWGRPCGVARPR